MAINFPDFPNLGDQFLVSGILYEWDGDSWASNTSVSFVGERIDSVFRQANASYSSQNTTGVYANSAFQSQNTTGVYANAAYGHANTRFASVGGTVSGDVIITGNLRVAGLTTYVSSTDLNIGDNIITLNADLAQDENPTEDAGIQVERGIENNVAVLWNETINKWVFTNNGAAYSNLGSSAAESYSNSAYLQANTNIASAAQADQRAVTSGVYANSAFDAANLAFILGGTIAGGYANSAYDQANTVDQRAVTSGVYANAAYNQANTVDQRAVTSGDYANSAYGLANTADQRAVTSGDYANSAYGLANTADQRAVTSGTYANSAYDQANTATTDAAQADQRAVTSGAYANSAYGLANTADQRAVTSGTYANSSFATANNKVSKSGDTINGTLTLVGGISQSSGDIDIGGSTYQTIVSVPSLDIDCSQGNYFTKTISTTSTFTFSNVPSSRAFMFALEITHTSGTINWPASVKWPFDTPPSLTTGTTHIFIFITDDGGTRWRGAALVDYVN